ncbi:hypothetical protein L207DRAFT_578592 [Hyaloscypha variabilis F]|uniref:2EXR domain-containing protein n=1 Tax=Hyaloscypha variabilis (strain UAMH 11265 / GT02V1 / F) TaxID=1149755 RepID=A0A2J6S4I7_HYAVF|nr:hypothetical protein L207DRAFT_578592 [Hyaloscypha variabilis F]
MHRASNSTFDLDAAQVDQLELLDIGGATPPVPGLNTRPTQTGFIRTTQTELPISDLDILANEIELSNMGQGQLPVPDLDNSAKALESINLIEPTLSAPHLSISAAQPAPLEMDKVSKPALDLNTPNDHSEILGMPQPTLDVSDLDMVATSSATIKTEPLTSFTCFPRFPAEIQRIVWKLAPYVPSLTTLNLEDLHLLSRSSMSARLNGTNTDRNDTAVSVDRSLVTICRTSRACALEEYGTPYTFEFRTTDSEDNESLTSTWAPAFQLYLTNSPSETFYFPREEALDDFRRFWRIVRGGKVQHSVIRSLALGDVRTRRLDDYDLARLHNSNGVWRNKDIKVLGTMSCFWPPFPELEALVIIDLMVVSSTAPEKHRQYPEPIGPSSKENVEIFVKTLEERLGRYPVDVERGAAEGPEGCTWSMWWKEPKVDIVSQEDFENRFH